MNLIAFKGSHKRNIGRMGIDISELTSINYRFEFDGIDCAMLYWSKAAPNTYLLTDESLLALKLVCPARRAIIFHDIHPKIYQFLKLSDMRLLQLNRKKATPLIDIFFENGKITEIDYWKHFRKIIQNDQIYSLLWYTVKNNPTKLISFLNGELLTE